MARTKKTGGKSRKTTKKTARPATARKTKAAPKAAAPKTGASKAGASKKAARGSGVERCWKDYLARRTALEKAVAEVRGAEAALAAARDKERALRAAFDDAKAGLEQLLAVEPASARMSTPTLPLLEIDDADDFGEAELG